MSTDCSVFQCWSICYLRVYTYILLYYINIYVYIHTYISYIFCMRKDKKGLCQDNKLSTLILHTTLSNAEKKILRVLCIRFRKWVVSSHVVRQIQHVDDAGCRAFFVSGLISMLIFCKFLVGASRFVVCIVASCISLPTGLTPTQMYTNPHL